ncbi:MAG: twin-arginine translocation signal domain-containing protein [Gammaproteobacteria bacterium]
MAATNRISRRDFLQVTASIAVTAAITLANGQTSPVSPEPAINHRLASLRGRPGTIIIAQQYFSLYPQHAKHAVLQPLIEADMAAHHGSLAALLKADFCASRTMLADGWLLALTEARLCALAGLPNAA